MNQTQIIFMSLTLSSAVKLNNGVNMPVVGLGVYGITPGKQTEKAVLDALGFGYRLIDTAALYENEESVGKAIKESKLKREEIFVTTKLWNWDQAFAQKAFGESKKKLGLDYIDLYLIHYPVTKTRVDAWKVMEKIYEKGQCKAIGVSNFMVNHLEDLLSKTSIVPTVNQIEFSPFLYRKELLEYCRKKKIQVEAYSPLTRSVKLNHEVIVEIAQKYSKSTAQIMLRWAIQHDVIPIPKSVHAKRIKENSKVFDFEIKKEDMKALDGLNEDFKVAWDPEGTP